MVPFFSYSDEGGETGQEPPAVRERLRAVLCRAGHSAHAERVRRARDTRTRERARRVLGARPGVEVSDHEADAVDQAFA